MTRLTQQSFEFDVVTVNPHGEEASRVRGRAESFTEDLGDGVGIEMVLIPGGSFLMGSPESERHRFLVEGPQHPVTVAPFYISKYPVTQEQWRFIVALRECRSQLQADRSDWPGSQRPVDHVSWWEGLECCQRLSRLSKHHYRLPTEAEWEYACRAGTTTPFHFGETITTDLANYCGIDSSFAWLQLSGSYDQGPTGVERGQTTAVGSFPPNAFGLYDMHGNVWEWCADDWHTRAHFTLDEWRQIYNGYWGAPRDGSAWLNHRSARPLKVMRGGCFSNAPHGCRSAHRCCSMAEWHFALDSRGLRLVCDVL